MNEFKKELERKRQERRSQKSSSWINLLIKIILFVFVIIMLGNLAKENDSVFKGFFYEILTPVPEQVPIK